jgi:dTMP kinase
MSRWGYFITFEGIEGCGKSTLAEGLKAFLESRGLQVAFTREPGGTEGAEAAREILLSREMNLDPWTELFLMLASRRENVVRNVRPALQAGRIVICDRYTDSSMAYQGYGRGLPLHAISKLNKLATSGIMPSLTFLVDIPVDRGFDRIRGREFDRFEIEDPTFHSRVREGYQKLARKARRRFRVLDGLREKEELLHETKEITLERLREKHYRIESNETR